ncbi:MAG: hypothetical protein U0169_08510 [Polyangiaceae bacterium]
MSDDSAESAATALKTRITPGTFSLKDSLDEEVNEFCNVHTILELSNAPGAQRSSRGRGRILQLHVDPNTRTFNVASAPRARIEGVRRHARPWFQEERDPHRRSPRTRLHEPPRPVNSSRSKRRLPGFSAITTTKYAVAKPAPTPPAPTFCANGRVVTEPNFIDSADGMQCSVPALHCVTKSMRACPMLSPLPPTFCQDGTIVRGPSRFITASDGLECEMPSVHCVTKDAFACPMLSPMHPDFCKDGTITTGALNFTASSDGKECQLPSIHCVTKDATSCPLF